MCAIAGYVLAGGRETSSVRLSAALRAMGHRGPDDEGLALIEPRDGSVQRLVTDESDPALRGRPRAGAVAELPHTVGLGHRRFAIIDPSPDGHQPFWSAGGTVGVAVNGEVYNYVELRRELEALGRVFRTASDTEVLLASYQEWGTGCFARLEGFWALALWDARRRRVLLARDRLGKAPLYVWRGAAGLFWASELKGLFALDDGARRRVNAQAVADFVVAGRRDVHGETCYEGVRSFPRASHAWVEPDGSFVAVPYWSLPERRLGAREVTPAEAASTVEWLLRQAVRRRLRADVPVGVQLSGGLDSSSILALAAQERERADAYTVRFADPEADEEPFARQAAERYAGRVRYHVIDPPDADLLDHADEYVSLMGEPFHSPNQFASQRVWREMHARGLRVVLYGAGGDEAFAGYPEAYWLPFMRALLRRGAVWRWLRESASSTEIGFGRQLLAHARRVQGRLPAALRVLALSGGPSPAHDPFLAPSAPRRREPAEDVEGLLRDEMTDWRMSYWVRLDNQNSMGVPVELRCPFLDHHLVEYAFRLPVEYLMRDGWMKWILRRAVEAHLPPAVVWRPRKMGFPFPLRAWLGRRKQALLSLASGTDCPFLDGPRLAEGYDAMAASHPGRLWRMLSVALWWKRCVLGQPLSAPVAPAVR